MFWNIPAYSLLLYFAFVQLFMLLAKTVLRFNSKFQKKWYLGFLIYVGLIVLGIILCFPLNQFISESTQGELNYELLAMKMAVWFMGIFLVVDIGLDFISRKQSKQSKVEYLHPPQ